MLPQIQSWFTIIASIPVCFLFLFGFGIIYWIRKEQGSKGAVIQIKISLVLYVKMSKSNHKKKIKAKDTKEMLYQTTCRLVVGSISSYGQTQKSNRVPFVALCTFVFFFYFIFLFRKSSNSEVYSKYMYFRTSSNYLCIPLSFSIG